MHLALALCQLLTSFKAADLVNPVWVTIRLTLLTCTRTTSSSPPTLSSNPVLRLLSLRLSSEPFESASPDNCVLDRLCTRTETGGTHAGVDVSVLMFC